MKNVSFILLLVVLVACRRGNDKNKAVETRTSGKTQILVDESFARVLDDQITVFKSDYPDAEVTAISGNENEILPDFVKGKPDMIILSRMLKPAEEQYYKRKQIPIYTDRFAIDGIALITNKANADSNILASEVLDVMRGTSKRKLNLVFDNAYSSTIRFFIDSAKVTTLPKTGVYTLSTNQDVVKYVAEHKDYIGVVGVNWLIEDDKELSQYLGAIKVMAVKNDIGKMGNDDFYKPSQNNLINGKYPFLRNIYIINCEGKNGLGTGFANWLASPRGQLIVLKSGLGPHKMLSRDFNLKNTN